MLLDELHDNPELRGRWISSEALRLKLYPLLIETYSLPPLPWLTVCKALEEEIKSTFRRLAKQLHPDLRPVSGRATYAYPGDADAERRLQQVIRTYETLSDRPSRMAYDAGRQISVC